MLCTMLSKSSDTLMWLMCKVGISAAQNQLCLHAFPFCDSHQ